MTTLAANPSPCQQTGRSEADTLAGLQQTVSASRLALFLQCRLRFYFRHVLGIPKARTPSLHVGKSVHAVLNAWNRARWLGQPFPLKQAHDTFTQAWGDQDQEPVDWRDGDEQQDKATGWRLCETYLRETNIDPAVKPDAVEVPVEADLCRHGLPKLIGILDLVQQRQIIDYKTTGTTPNPDKAAHTHEVQTSTYAVLYRESTGSREVGIQLHHLVKLKNPRLVITALPPMSQPQQTRLFHLIDAYQGGLERRDFVPSPGMQCSGCEFFNECRQWR